MDYIEFTYFECLDALKYVKLPSKLNRGWDCLYFVDCPNLTTLIMPKSVGRDDGIYFRNCPKLTEIVLPEGITTLTSRMFIGCTGLRNVIIPDSVTEIDGSAFQESGIEKFILPEGAKFVGDYISFYRMYQFNRACSTRNCE